MDLWGFLQCQIWDFLYHNVIDGFFCRTPPVLLLQLQTLNNLILLYKVLRLIFPSTLPLSGSLHGVFFLPLLQDHWSFLLNYLICYSDHWIGYSFQIVNIFLSGICSFIYFYNEIPYFFPSLCSWFPLNPWTYLYLVLGLYMILLSVISMFVPTECFFSWLKITSSCFFMCFQFFSGHWLSWCDTAKWLDFVVFLNRVLTFV